MTIQDIFDQRKHINIDKSFNRGVMKYKKQHLGTMDGFDIYIVDGKIIRNNIFIDFTVGGSTNQNYWIPENEIFIDYHIREDERDILMKRFVFLEQACRRGENAEEALERIYNKEREYRKQISKPGVTKKIITKIGSLTLSLVDGEQVRNNIDIEFAMGGNDCAYAFQPKESIWIDVNFQDEFIPILFHEMIERNKMLEGQNYFQAHEEANTLGSVYLNEPDKMRNILLNEFKKSFAFSQRGLKTTKKHYHSLTATFE